MVRSCLTKAEFATYICDSEVWDKAFYKENIKEKRRAEEKVFVIFVFLFCTFK